MAYLGLALFAEGPTDHRFLKPLLRRLCEHLCLNHAKTIVEIGDVLEIHTPARVKNEKRDIRVLEAAKDALYAWHILFVHTDGAGDPDRALTERIEPSIQRIVDEMGSEKRRGVAVVPVRETEAWCLVDGEALRKAIGVSRDDECLGLQEKPADVEKWMDPKQALDDACQKAISPNRRRRRGQKGADFLDQIGEFVSLEKLNNVPAFRKLYQELYDALTFLGYLDKLSV
jgi:hypothetical protein